MGLNPLTIKDLEFPEGKLPELLIYDWGNAGKTFIVRAITRHGMTSQKYTSSSNRSMSTRSFRIDDLPIAVMAEVGEGNVRRGEIYVLVNLRLGQVVESCLLCGYISHERRLTWPPGVFEPSIEGPGLLRSVTGTDPAAGAEIVEPVPTNARWLLHSIHFKFVTDATVAARRVYLCVDDGTTDLLEIPCLDTQAESLTRYYRWQPSFESQPGEIGTCFYTILSHPIKLFQGWRIKTVAVNLKAGDNYGAPQMLIEEWLEE